MVDIPHRCQLFTLHSRHHQRCPAPQIGGMDLRTAQIFHAAHHGHPALGTDIGTHAPQLRNVAVSVFKHILHKHGGAPAAHKGGHQHRLGIGGKPGIGRCAHLTDAPQPSAALQPDSIFIPCHPAAGLTQRRDHRSQMTAVHVLEADISACAGSTGGGFKCSRVLILTKSLHRRTRQILYPQNVQVVRLSNHVINEQVVSKTAMYLVGYMFITVLSTLVISLDHFSLTTNLSAVIACFNNIGPGFDVVGATGNYSAFSDFSKIVLIFDMLAGRLEIFPILVLFSRRTWKR